MSVILDINKEQHVIIHLSVFDTIYHFRQKHFFNNEKGGIIIGSCYESGLVISDVTTPQKTDISYRFGFIRKNLYHQEYMDNAWRNSGKIKSYIGEWHTHPEDNPSPSYTDLQSWKLIKSDIPLLFMIQGRKSCWCGVKINDSIMYLDNINIYN